MKRLLIALCIAFLIQPIANSAAAQTIQHGVNVSWSWSGTGTATYNVYRSTTSGAEAKPPIVSGITITTYNDSTAIIGTKYYYTVTATVGGVESVPSAEVSAQIVLPNPPTNPQTAVY
jgi:fibronectin type 3 domain-containing protein